VTKSDATRHRWMVSHHLRVESARPLRQSQTSVPSANAIIGHQEGLQSGITILTHKISLNFKFIIEQYGNIIASELNVCLVLRPGVPGGGTVR